MNLDLRHVIICYICTKPRSGLLEACSGSLKTFRKSEGENDNKVVVTRMMMSYISEQFFFIFALRQYTSKSPLNQYTSKNNQQQWKAKVHAAIQEQKDCKEKLFKK